MKLARLSALIGLLLIASLIASAQVNQTPQTVRPEAPPAGVEILWGVRVPMRDGVRLNATVYKPKGVTDPQPVIFTLTPYIGDTYHERAMYFAQHGYIFALVDVRGRGNSEGSFEPFANEGRDGYDAVEWLARQPWSNGKVTMWGGSYAGFDQWSILKEFPPHLVTIVPAAAAHAAVDFPFFKNIFTSYDMQWLTYTSGVTPNRALFGESSFWIDRFRELYMKHLPYNQLDRVVGNTSTVFQKWLQHPQPDAYWDAMSPQASDYRRMNIPILTITGSYDGDQRGAMQYYRSFMQYASQQAQANHYLIIGPWDHAGTRTPNPNVGGLHFAQSSVVDLNKLHREWYDWVMKGGAKPEFLKKRVAYYLMGADEWKYADSLNSISNQTLKFYLDSDGHATDAFHSGTLSRMAKSPSPPDHYTYDPLDTRPAELEREDVPNYLTDERGALNLFGSGLVYTSEPLMEDTEVTGYLKLTACIEMDVPDTDFAVQVYEIKQDGTSIVLTDDLMRARYRESLREAKLIRPGEINRYEFNSFQFFSRRIAKGSRLRLVISSPNTIYLQKNYNSGGNIAEESERDARTAHVTLYHDAAHTSFLEIPVVR